VVVAEAVVEDDVEEVVALAVVVVINKPAKPKLNGVHMLVPVKTKRWKAEERRERGPPLSPGSPTTTVSVTLGLLVWYPTI